MAEWLEALAALPKDSGFISTTHTVVAHNHWQPQFQEVQHSPLAFSGIRHVRGVCNVPAGRLRKDKKEAGFSPIWYKCWTRTSRARHQPGIFAIFKHSTVLGKTVSDNN